MFEFEKKIKKNTFSEVPSNINAMPTTTTNMLTQATGWKGMKEYEQSQTWVATYKTYVLKSVPK